MDVNVDDDILMEWMLGCRGRRAMWILISAEVRGMELWKQQANELSVEKAAEEEEEEEEDVRSNAWNAG